MKRPIAERIRTAFRPGESRLDYHELARRVFPPADYPRAWRYAVQGGPPGCFMALSAAIRRMGLHEQFKGVGERYVFRPPSSEEPRT